MSGNDKLPPSTAICGYDEEDILIRGKNLVSELMGNYSFTELFLLQALGEEPNGHAMQDRRCGIGNHHGTWPGALLNSHQVDPPWCA